MKIVNGFVFVNGEKFEKRTIDIEKDTIAQIHSLDDLCNSSNKWTPKNFFTKNGDSLDGFPNCDIIDATNCYVVPGFLDLHFHGCMGYDFSNGNLNEYKKMAIYQLQNGMTSICPATMTLPEETLLQIVSNGKLIAQTNANGETANFLGFHLEGPFLSKEKKGAQNEKYIMSPDIAMFQRFLEASDGYLKLTTIAPEIDGAMKFIETFHNEVSISLGHTMTDYATALQAFQKGANHVTHLFNAMPGLHHRESGLIGAAFDMLCQKSMYIELICDGIHVSDSMIRSAFALFSDESIVLISDSMSATGMPDGIYSLGGQEVFVEGKSATLKDGTLAGSVTNLYECFLHVVKIGIPLESALKTVTINPAKSIGTDHKYGSIAIGKMADLLILNADLSIRDIIFHGKKWNTDDLLPYKSPKCPR